jgi:hypothetical protein
MYLVTKRKGGVEPRALQVASTSCYPLSHGRTEIPVLEVVYGQHNAIFKPYITLI